MKKILTLIWLIFSITAFSQKQLRDYIVIVRPVYHQSTTDFLLKFSDEAKNQGHEEVSQYLKNFAEGKGFGSGFLVEGDDGKVYVLTNKHVVMQAASAIIEFSNTDGSKVMYDGCRILRLDEENDLALLSFPEEVKNRKALKFSEVKPADGKDVFSAGFPGMAGKPVWQFGQGIVSNADFSMSVLDEELKAKVIQHSAQIDRGSSGSPLLVADTSQLSGYAVIGMNTWKVFNRENVNLAIPVTDIRSFITKTLHAEKPESKEILEMISRQFVNDAMHGYKKILKYISYNYVSGISIDEFFRLWKKTSEAAKEDIAQVFLNSNPVEAARVAIADNLYRSIEKQKTTLTFTSVAGVPSAENPTHVTLSYNNKPVTSEWMIEQNQWKLKSISTLKLNEREDFFGIANDFRPFGTVLAEVYFPGDPVEKTGVGLDISMGNRTLFGLSLMKCAHLGYEWDYSGSTSVIKSEGYINYTQSIVYMGYQYPLRLSGVYLIPYFKFGLGLITGGLFSLTTAYWYGFQAAYKLKNDKFVSAFLKIAPRNIDMMDMIEDNDPVLSSHGPFSFPGISIGVGYSF